VIKGLGYPDVAVTTVASQIFTVAGVPSLDTEADSALRKALGELFPLTDLQTFQEGDKPQIAILFKQLPNEGVIQTALSNLGHPGAQASTQDGKNFVVTLEALDEEARAQLEKELPERLVEVQEVKTTLIKGTLIDLTFQSSEDVAELDAVLTDLGFPQARVTEVRTRDFDIELPSLSVEQELTFQTDLAQLLGTVQVNSLRREEPTSERMDGVLDTIQRRVNAFGITEPIVQRLGDDRVVVQLPGAEDTNITLTFRDSVADDILLNALKDLGHGRATVDRKEGELLPNSVDILIQGLTQESQDKIRGGLETKFGALEQFSFNEPTGRVRVGFSQPFDVADLRTTLNDLGFTNPVIGLARGSTFLIRTATLTTAEQEKLRQDLTDAFSPISSFVVTGGVEEAKALIGQTAQLVLKERTCLNADCSQFTDKDAVGAGGEPLTGDRLVSAFAGTHPTTGLPIVNFVFDGTGSRIFRDLTTRIAGDPSRCVAHILDGESLICPVAREAIRSGSGFIEGPDFTFDRVRRLAIQLESGSLPVSLGLVRESTVDSLLGDESLKASLKAGFVGLGLVALYMVVYYRMAGLMAALALAIYALISFAIFKMVPVTLTLSGLAGLILSVGMAVDANIVIFERLKEELRAGRSLLSAMEIGFRRAWPAIRDGNVSTFISCGILFFFGRQLGEPTIIGFSVTLAVGTAVAMFTAINITRNFMQLLMFTPASRNLNLFSPERVQRAAAAAGGEK
jgi:protein-export membrane protein SecD